MYALVSKAIEEEPALFYEVCVREEAIVAEQTRARLQKQDKKSSRKAGVLGSPMRVSVCILMRTTKVERLFP